MAAPAPRQPESPRPSLAAVPPAVTEHTTGAAGGYANGDTGGHLVEHDPTLVAASPEGWRRWWTLLITQAKTRLVGATLLLILGLVVEGAALWFFGDLAGEVSRGDTQSVDDGVFHFLRTFSSPGLDEIARLISSMGAEVLGVLLLVILAYFALRRRWGTAVSLMLVTVGAQLLNDVLKDHFRRTRPMAVASIVQVQSWSFPSGHAMVSAAFYLFLAYVGWRLLRGLARALWTSALVLLIALIGLARMYLGAHYLTDVVAGYTAGAAWTLIVVVAGQSLTVRRRRVSAQEVAEPALAVPAEPPARPAATRAA